jgi:phosphoenolpyruvate carboxylase
MPSLINTISQSLASIAPFPVSDVQPHSHTEATGGTVAWPSGLSSSKTMEFAKETFAAQIKTLFAPEIIELGNTGFQEAVARRESGLDKVNKFDGDARTASKLIKYQQMRAHAVEVLHAYQKIEQLSKGPSLAEKLKGITATDAEALVWVVVTAHPTLFSHPDFSQLTINILDTLTDMFKAEMESGQPSPRNMDEERDNRNNANLYIKNFVKTPPIRSAAPTVDEEHRTYTIGDDLDRKQGGHKNVQRFVGRMGDRLNSARIKSFANKDRIAGTPVEAKTRFQVFQGAADMVNRALGYAVSRVGIKFSVWAGGADHDGHPDTGPDNVINGSIVRLTKQFEQYDKLLSSSSQDLPRLQQPSAETDHVRRLVEGFRQLQADPENKVLIDRLGLSEEELENPACQAIAYVRIRMTSVVDYVHQRTAKHKDQYEGIEDMQRDVEAIKNAIEDGSALDEVLSAMHSFQGYYMSADLRQNSSVFKAGAAEFLRDRLGDKKYEDEDLSVQDKCRYLLEALTDPEGLKLDHGSFSKETRKELAIIRAGLHMNNIFKGAVNCQIVADHTDASNFLEAALAIAAAGGYKLEKDEDTDKVKVELSIPIVPLFEPIDAVQNSHKVVDEILTTLEDAQITMPGTGLKIMYARSDSNKDGGILCAEWEVYKAKERLGEVAAKHNTEIGYIFDGGGGSYARGGGNVIQKIATDASVGDTMRRTFQGEQIIGDTSSTLLFAHHLADMLVANDQRRKRKDKPEPARFTLVKDALSGASREGYLKNWRKNSLVQKAVLALSEQLQVKKTFPGSRPNTRPKDRKLSAKEEFFGMRAIGNNVATAFARMPIQAFFGIGYGIGVVNKDDGLIKALMDDPEIKQRMRKDKTITPESVVMSVLQEMYHEDGFTNTLFDGVEMALAMANPGIGKEHINLVQDLNPQEREELFNVFNNEFEATKTNLLKIMGQDHLLQKLKQGNPDEYQLVQARFAEADAINASLLAMHVNKAKDDPAVPIATSGIATALPGYVG